MRAPNPQTSFAIDHNGSIAVVFALGFAVVAAFAGLAIDYGNASHYKTALQSIADRAVMAAAASPLPNVADRVAIARTTLQTALTLELPKTAEGAVVSAELSGGGIHVRITAHVRGYVSPVIGIDAMDVSVDATATSQHVGRALDIAMCIDATGSMQFLINGVISRALGFYGNLNSELVGRGLPEFDLIRVRPIFFRDFDGNVRYNAADGWLVDKFPLGWQVRPASVPTNNGDDVPLRAATGFFKLPFEETLFADFVQPEVESGGGDYTESGLECLNEAMNSPWLKVGDPITAVSGDVAASSVMSVVAIWSDENAHEPSHAFSLDNPNYPADTVMPRDYAGLAAKWSDPAVIPQANKLLVHFYPNGLPQSGIAPTDPTSGWAPILAWDKYMRGGALDDGVTHMIEKIADAVATMPVSSTPVLTN